MCVLTNDCRVIRQKDNDKKKIVIQPWDIAKTY